MEIDLIIQKKKEIHSSLMEFIDTTENIDIEKLIDDFEQQNYFDNKEEIVSILQMVSKIADNHHRMPNFINKLGEIIHYLIQKIPHQITNDEVYQIYKDNKRILLLLFEQGIIQPDQNIINDINGKYDGNGFPYKHYLYSGIKNFITESESMMIEKEIKAKYKEEINIFIEKCRIGENDSYISFLIRQDLVEEFISYTIRSSTSLSSRIQPSIFETNSFLYQKNPTLIEYAFFYGSDQIVKFLQQRNVSITYSLWPYAIQYDKAEMIHFL